MLVFSNLSFLLLIGINVLQPHAEKMSLASAAPLELSAPVCEVSLEQKTNSNPSYRSSPTVACVAESTTVAPKSASLVTVRLPRAVQSASTVVIEPLNSTVVIFGCAALPAVCVPVVDVCRVAVVNNSDKPIEMLVVSLSLLSTLYVPPRNRLKPQLLPLACPTSRNSEKCFTS